MDPPDVAGSRKWIVGVTANRHLIGRRVLQVDGEDRMINKATGFTSRKKGLVRGPAHQEATNGMLRVPASYRLGRSGGKQPTDTCDVRESLHPPKLAISENRCVAVGAEAHPDSRPPAKERNCSNRRHYDREGQVDPHPNPKRTRNGQRVGDAQGRHAGRAGLSSPSGGTCRMAPSSSVMGHISMSSLTNSERSMRRRGQPMFRAATYRKRCNRPSSTSGGSRNGTISQLFGPMRQFQMIRRLSKNPPSMADVNYDGGRRRFTRCRVL